MDPLPTYNLKIEQRPGFAYALLTAPEVRMSDAARYVAEMADECGRLGTDKLLIDRRVDGAPSRTLAYYKVAEIIDKFPPCTRVAFVDEDPASRERLNWALRQAQTDAVSFHIFADAADAEQWLLTNADPPTPGWTPGK